MRRALCALLAVASVAAAGCGGDEAKTREREQVDRYAKAENRVVEKLAPSLEAVNRTYLAFAKRKLKARVAQRRLADAERVIGEVGDGVAALDPPAAAAELHRRLERYLGETRTLAAETSKLAGYQDAAEAALAGLGPANRKLQRRLAGTGDPATQERGLDDFVTALDAVLDDLRAVEVPIVQRPAHRDQVRRLTRTRDLAGQLLAALRAEDAPKVAKLLGRFREQSADRADADRLRDAGLRRYERRIDALKTAAADIRREQLRLYKSLSSA